MGILSFTVFVYSNANYDSAAELLPAFELAHIVILFIAISFILTFSGKTIKNDKI